MGAIEEFLELIQKPNTIKTYKNSFTRFFKALYGDGDLNDHVERYLSEDRDQDLDFNNILSIMRGLQKQGC